VAESSVSLHSGWKQRKVENVRIAISNVDEDISGDLCKLISSRKRELAEQEAKAEEEVLQALPQRERLPLLVDGERWQLERDVQTPLTHPMERVPPYQ